MQRIISVEKNTPAHTAGLLPGDILISIGGEEIRDVLDYMFFANDAELELEIERSGRPMRVHISKQEDEELGLIFETGLMDKKRSCRNKCVFCFVDQLPRGMRGTLYFKDDDERLSFMMGNYITLTNLSASDLERIKKLRLSPLNISVHASDNELRRLMLGNKRAEPIIDIMRSLAEAGITMNCQIVCCPGLNDGQVLRDTLNDLIALYPRMASVSVVPVGLTRHREGLYPLRQVGLKEAGEILDVVLPIGKECMKAHNMRIIYPADELFIKAGREMPGISFYDDFPQLENGVGMIALFRDDFLYTLEQGGRPAGRRFTLVTGVSAAPFIDEMARLTGADYEVIPIENDFFGRSIDVTGLVCGCDIIKTLKGRKIDLLVIPDVMLRDGNDRFLDDTTPADLQRELGCPVRVIGSGGEHLAGLLLGKE